jgi:hypothetical protein
MKGSEDSQDFEVAKQPNIVLNRCSLARREEEFEDGEGGEGDEEEEEESEATVEEVTALANQMAVCRNHGGNGGCADFMTSTTRQLSTSDDLLNSETMYRNEIRKSARNILQHKRNSAIAVNDHNGKANNNNKIRL